MNTIILQVYYFFSVRVSVVRTIRHNIALAVLIEVMLRCKENIMLLCCG